MLQRRGSIRAVGATGLAPLAVVLARPAVTIPLIHNWWGLNDQIKAVAAHLAA